MKLNNPNYLNGLTSSASEIDGSVKSKQANTIVLLGDSITAGNSNGWFDTTPGFFTWGNSLAGNPLRMIYNAGIGGETSTQILARIDSDVIARNPSYCLLLMGTNDLGNGSISINLLNSNISQALAKLSKAGIYTFICTIPPTREGYRSASVISNILSANRHIQNIAINNKFVEVVDIYGAFIDPTTTTFRAKPNLLRDDVHPSNYGGMVGGLELAKHLKDIKINRLKIASNSDCRASNASSSNLVSNPLLTGTTGKKVLNVTGSVADGYTITHVSTGNTVCSKEVRVDGYGENQVLTITANSSSDWVRLDSPKIIAPELAIGDIFYCEAEVFIPYGAVGLTNAELWANTNNSGLSGSLAKSNTPYYPLIIPSEGITLTLRTRDYTMGANGVNTNCSVLVYFNGAGSATVKIGRISFIKLN